MADDSQFEQQVQGIIEEEVIVLRDVHNFPVYDKEFVSPNLVLGINISGTAHTLYDNHEVVFNKNEIAVVLPNHLMKPIGVSGDYSAVLIVMSSPFINELKVRTLTHDYYKYHLAPSYTMTEKQMQTIAKVIDIIEEISTYSTQMENRHEILIYQVDILFEILGLYRYEQDKHFYNISKNTKLFNDFCDLLAKHYRESHEVNFYADKLNITPKYFSKVIFETIKMTPMLWIEQYLLTKAKHLLSTRKDMSVQQISYHLGFNEQSSFCRFFKRLSGETPRDYMKHK